MADFTDLISQAKKMQEKIKETQEVLKKIEVEGISGGGSIKVTLNGDSEMIKLFISPTTITESKEIIEDLILAAHSNAKKQLQTKTSEEISKVTGGISLPPGFKFPL